MPKLGRELTPDEQQVKNNVIQEIEAGKCVWVEPHAVYLDLDERTKLREGKIRGQKTKAELEEAFAETGDLKAKKHAKQINDKNTWYARTHAKDGNKLLKPSEEPATKPPKSRMNNPFIVT